MKLDRIIMIRDANLIDETPVEQNKSDVSEGYWRPRKIAELILDNMKNCAPMFRTHKVLMLDDEGCHPL